MCGIIGILSYKNIVPSLLDGLKRLEYRGYDSSGIATLLNGRIVRCRSQGKLDRLEKKLDVNHFVGTIGIGHTRWATHGKPTEENAHPHVTERVGVVHNGIIENYKDLKLELESVGACFLSQTDTEVIAHLIDFYLKQGMSPQLAADTTFRRLEGAFAVALIFSGQDNLMIGCRRGAPLVVGYGDGEMFLASDSYALAPLTKKISFLEDGDRVFITRENVLIYTYDNIPVQREIRITSQDNVVLEGDNYPHFMLKEIHEQPRVMESTLKSFVDHSLSHVQILPDILHSLSEAPRLTLIACGTAFYACMVAKYWFESIARIPCEIDIASEFRYREPPLPDRGVAILVSQSGETLDTLEALRYCRRQGHKVISIVNTIESTIERESDFVLHTLAGPEIGVASTKAFTTQLIVLSCLAIGVSASRGLITDSQEKKMIGMFAQLFRGVKNVLAHENLIMRVAKEIVSARDVLYLGRGSLYPIALEGALKLKEVSYIHADGYAAGEMKHGSIALIDERVPVVVFAPSNDSLFEKMVNNIQEVAARGGKILLISDLDGIKNLKHLSTWCIEIDMIDPFLSPILYTIPIQLLSYHVASAKGFDVDRPRNLAKSVTVE